MKKSHITSGRIIQRVIDKINANKNSNNNIIVVHGVDYQNDIDRIIDNLLKYFPSCQISLQKLDFGYELKIVVERYNFKG